MNGILVIDKPQGCTSFDVVSRVRRITGEKKAGHTGTLDPNATGVLPILLGRATKAQDLIPNHDKSYTAGFRLGITTDTLDIWGSVLSEKSSRISAEELSSLLEEFTGKISQIPPMYSAVKLGGERLYDLARRGIEVERSAREVVIYSVKLCKFDEKAQSGTLNISCSRGTYVRSLIDDMGAKLGCGAVMTSLRRTRACGFSLDDAVTLEQAQRLAEENLLSQHLKSVESLFEGCRALRVTEAQAKRFRNGGALDVSRTRLADESFDDGEIFRIKSPDGLTAGLGKVCSEKNEIKIYLHL